MPQRRALNDDGSPETPDRASWDGGAAGEGAGETEAVDAGSWMYDAARLRAPGEEDGPEAPEEAPTGSSPEEGSPAPESPAPVDDGSAPATEPAPVPSGEETGGDTPPEEGGGAREEGPAARRTAFVEAIVADPANPPAVRLLAGWIGAAAEKGKTRIYLDLALGRWIDLPTGDVLHAAKEGPGRLARTLVWVRARPPALSGGAAGGEAGTEMQDEGPFHAP